ncbi:Beauvericin cluster-specific repressor BEA4 [Pseudocercospora fuligena]|uniref:Beauvericin cluster-specific repressor BEA4 n=1 Tax=Pseudocercospora fuligena TaxID=685502 RepID=A0A8H6VJB1_9PEZI|nr:Beauvericin cluster-specific repressor BEA4 [Pseudocercospora fuligena]
MGEPTTGRPKISKSRNGCGECKRKRMKCDEHLPTCWNCAHRKVECPGYTRELKWSTKYEKFKTPRSRAKSAATRRTASPLRQEFQQVIQAIGSRRSTLVSLSDEETPSATGGNIHVANKFHLTTNRPADDEVVTETPRQERRRSSSSSHASDCAQKAQADDAPLNSGSDHGQDTIALNPTFQHDLPDSQLREASEPHDICGPDSQHLDADQDLMRDSEDDDEEVGRSPSFESALVSSPGLQQYLALWNEFAPSSDDRAVDRLVPHYFETICRVMSCFDSTTNPYRTDIPGVLHSSPYIFNCMMGMAAAHMANYEKDMAVTAISYQTEAMQSLQLQMSGLLPLSSINGGGTTYQTLLGTIMLGMTSAWHDPTANGMSHLRGARLLFRAWSQEQQLYDSSSQVKILTREQNFIVGSMAYWECLASFICDQPIGAIHYLLPFCTLAEGQIVYPHSWTGVSTPMFILTAQVGILLRQKRVLEKLSLIRRGAQAKDTLDLELIQDASDLHDKIMEYDLPPMEAIEDTGDLNTPVSHLCEVAKVYRFTALLELYRAFPLLAQHPTAGNITMDPTKVQSNADDLAFDLATSIITIVADMPRSSGVYTVLCIPLISAGSALQAYQTGFSAVSKADLGAELTCMRRSRSNVDCWRENTRQQILHTSRQIGLAPFKRLAKLVQEVWTRSDMHADMAADPETPIHWIDVMMEQHLETLFG